MFFIVPIIGTISYIFGTERWSDFNLAGLQHILCVSFSYLIISGDKTCFKKVTHLE